MTFLTRISKILRFGRDRGLRPLLQAVLLVLARRVGGPSGHQIIGDRLGGEVAFELVALPARLTPAALARKGRSVYIVSDQEQGVLGLPSNLPLIRSVGDLSKEEIASAAFYVYFECDSTALREVRKIAEGGGLFVPPMRFEKTHYRFVNELALEALRRTSSSIDRISHFHPNVHENICEALYLTRDVLGDYVEIGVYKGGSALTALNFIKILDERGAGRLRKCWCLDTFDGFSYSTALESSDAFWAGTHTLFGPTETMGYVDTTLRGTGVPYELARINVCSDPLPDAIKQIAVANIDVDLFEATRDALRKIHPLMSVGGIIICEDPASTPGLYGALLAMEDFLETSEGRHYLRLFKGGQYFLIRQR